MLKNKIQLNKFEDLIDFIKRFMNYAASHLATSNSGGCSKWKVFIGRRCVRGGISKRKERIIFIQVFFGEGNGRGFIMKIILLVLIRRFQINWFKIPFLGEVEAAIRLVINFWFGDVV